MDDGYYLQIIQPGELILDQCAVPFYVEVECMLLSNKKQRKFVYGGMDDNYLEFGWKKLVKVLSLQLPTDDA